MSKEDQIPNFKENILPKFDKLFFAMYDIWSNSCQEVREYGKERFIKTCREILVESLETDLQKQK